LTVFYYILNYTKTTEGSSANFSISIKSSLENKPKICAVHSEYKKYNYKRLVYTAQATKITLKIQL